MAQISDTIIWQSICEIRALGHLKITEKYLPIICENGPMLQVEEIFIQTAYAYIPMYIDRFVPTNGECTTVLHHTSTVQALYITQG